MSRDNNSDNGLWQLIKQFEQKKGDGDNTFRDKSAGKISIKNKKRSSSTTDKSSSDKEATCDRSGARASSDNISTGKGDSYARSDKRPIIGVTGARRVASDKSSGIDNGTSRNKLISSGTMNYISAGTIPINNTELFRISSVSDNDFLTPGDKLLTPAVKQDFMMIDDVIRTRLITNPVRTDKAIPIIVTHVDSSASHFNGSGFVATKAAAGSSGRESRTVDDAAALRLISNSDAHDKPMRNRSETAAKARRPGFLTLSPISPSETDEEKTPRPLSGSFRSADATPISEFSFIELPLRFRQYQCDNKTGSVPLIQYPDSAGTSNDQYHLDTENRNANQNSETRVVSDDIIVALQWIQQELRQMKSHDRAIVRQLLGLGASIHQLRGLTDCRSFNTDDSEEREGERTPDWTIPVHASSSLDSCGHLAGQLTSPSTVKGIRARRMEAGVSRRSREAVSLSTSDADHNEFYV